MLTLASSTAALALCHRRQDSPGNGGGEGAAGRETDRRGGSGPRAAAGSRIRTPRRLPGPRAPSRLDKPNAVVGLLESTEV